MMRKEEYLNDISRGQDFSVCRLALQPLDAPFNIIGSPIYSDYYVKHDWEDGVGTMSWSPL